MILSRFTLKNFRNAPVTLPEENIFELPEKVLQFGTGVLLRGLPDYFIDKANRNGIFNGRIVVVKSTTAGDASAFEKQDGLYTTCIRGIEQGKLIEENIVNASISRVLNANDEWESVLQCAHDINMQIIVSNTTESGIELVHDNIRHHPPRSFPGKVLGFLHERFQAFGGSDRSGMVIVPTELIPDNGKKLESIVLELAHLNGLDDRFIEWLESSNHFCSSLVDRIVPGKPDNETASELSSHLGFTDHLLLMSESYALWAIEGNERVRHILTFAQADRRVIIDENIDRYRELKLRLLNGTHTLSCAVALLAGCQTVEQAMKDELVGSFIENLMLREIAPAIPYELSSSEAIAFGKQVLDRFRNPLIRHQWSSIAVNYTSKIRTRVLPLINRHYANSDSVPELMSMGFASYLLLIRPKEKEEGKYYTVLDGQRFQIEDEAASYFYKRWHGLSTEVFLEEVINDTAFWGLDLQSLPGFRQALLEKAVLIEKGSIAQAVSSRTSKKGFAA